MPKLYRKKTKTVNENNDIKVVSEVTLSYKTKVNPKDRAGITRSQDAYKLLFDSWNKNTIEYFEEFKLLLLNRSNAVLGILAVSKGGISGTVTDVASEWSFTKYDKLTRLLKITDSGTASSLVDDYPCTSQNYTYDSNGNMIHDGAKNFNIVYYRSLNLPQYLDFYNNTRIFYHYSATGAKLAKHTVPATGTSTLTHYVGNIVYEGGTLIYILTDEGRLVADGTGANRKFLYEYSIKDHLGNDRVVFMGSNLAGAIDIVQTNSYYPFRLVMNHMNGNTSPECWWQDAWKQLLEKAPVPGTQGQDREPRADNPSQPQALDSHTSPLQRS